ncbi:Dihydrolipoyl dehydrogenase [Candidatus Neptunochlamydia vexilliferae]|uniref:Dihydrolipoyl dehydrogenase n=2 Tax=Candidatus Neptunichlamydia vexilliferae TaxID=1651774 RepID=A0ABS0B208_9BACT|nr:Dihydrolipoyl dehydrogenase [Candidatus Neptunochlamydia vexilliferae]
MGMAEKQKFDLAVIGAGPGGYVAAIKGAQMGKKVALIEKENLGGTCLNVGCIPSKALLSNAAIFNKIKHAEDFGINVEKVSFDYGKMKTRKDKVVSGIRQSLGGLLKSNGITIFEGFAKFESPKELKVKGKDNALIQADKIIIATGSQPIDIPAFPCDHERILNSTSALELTELPQSMAIIGGGYIGCEFASLFAEFGVKVTIIEALPSIVQAQGKTISEALTSAFTKRGIDIKTNTAVEKIDKTEKGLVVHFKGGDSVSVDKAVVSVGRRLNSEGLGLDKAGLKPGPKGAIEVNEKMETDVPGIYAIGDITAIAMLAHVASHQGIVAAANACGQEAHLHYNAIPAVIFTHPEIAMVGLTAEEAQEKGLNINIGTFPFQALGKSVATNETEGFAQVISDKQTGEIYGAQVIGHEASAMIAEMALAINNELTLECVTDTIHAHPTIPEAWLEASLLANETPIHFPPKRKK